MEERKKNTAIIAVTIALIAVIAVLVAVFFLMPASEEEGIILPDVQNGLNVEQEHAEYEITEFAEITEENINDVLSTLIKPAFYHQRYDILVGNGISIAPSSVELWANDGLLHAEVRKNNQKKSILSDGSSAWIWYESDLAYKEFRLTDDLTLEDVLGIPSLEFDTILERADITRCYYDYLADDAVSCIVVSVQNKNSNSDFWFSLDSGLLYKTATTENEEEVYSVIQTVFDRLAANDQAFSGRFCLPDGTVPFIEQ